MGPILRDRPPGVGKPNSEGASMATLWFAFVFFPIIPLRRERFAPHQGTGYRFVSVERAWLTAIATTCLFGGLLLAALLMCPFPFVVIVVWL